MRKFFSTIIIAAALSGCTAQSIVEANGGPTREQATSAPRRPLSPEETKIVQDAIASTLKDPAAAQFKMPLLVMWKRPNSSYVYCAQVNGKNSYGGYVGFSWSYNVVFTDEKGKITDVRPIGVDSGEIHPDADLCAANGY